MQEDFTTDQNFFYMRAAALRSRKTAAKNYYTRRL